METKAEESAPKPAAAPEKVAQDPLRVVFYGLSDAEEKNLRVNSWKGFWVRLQKCTFDSCRGSLNSWT